MTWAAVAIGAGTAISAGVGYLGSQNAADAQKDASKDALRLQQQQYLAALQMLEPQRGLGYGATQDLATLYGYGLPAYTPLNQLATAPGMQPIGVKAGGSSVGGSGGGASSYGPNPNPLAGLAGGPFDSLSKNPLDYVFGGGGLPDRYGGTINPLTGTVDVAGKDAAMDQVFTDYLRGGARPEFSNKRKAKRYSDLIAEIDRLRANGFTWNAEAGQPGTPPAAGAPATTPGVQGSPSMSRFFTSPDYQFRRDEGQRDIGNSFAARGGAASGNALRALSDFNSQLASQEFGNYYERLMRMAGMGGAATNNAVNIGQNYAGNAGNLLQAQGDARASGIMGGANSISNSINNGLNLWAWQRQFQQPQQPTATPNYSPYGPWATGYKFGG